MESGALTADSKGGNDLFNSGVDEDLVNFKEGACSGSFVKAVPDYMRITDASLDSGFPCKSGEANKTFSIAVRFKTADITLDQYMVSKQGTNVNSFIFYLKNNVLKIAISSLGNNWNSIGHDTALQSNRWYHAAVTYDNSDYSIRLRIWDYTAGAIVGVDKTGILTNIFIGSGYVFVGYLTTLLDMGGNLDEVVVFNDVLSVAEIDEIRAGIYGGGAVVSKFGSLFRNEKIEQKIGMFAGI